MAHIAAGRLDHISPTKSDEFPIQLTSKDDGTSEFCTVAYAVDRLSGYYRDDPEGWIEATLLEGTPLQTISFVYKLA